MSKLLQKLADCYKFSIYKEKQMVLLWLDMSLEYSGACQVFNLLLFAFTTTLLSFQQTRTTCAMHKQLFFMSFKLRIKMMFHVLIL